MPTKNSKLVADSIISLGRDKYYKRYSVHDLMELTGLSADEIVSAVELLEQNGMAQVSYLNSNSRRPMIDFIRLTESGIHYKDFQRADMIRYIKDKWIDFLALIVAVAALLKSFESEILCLLQK